MGFLKNEKAKEEKKRAKEIEELFKKLKTEPWAKGPKVMGEMRNRLGEIGQPALEKIIEMSKDNYAPNRYEAMGLLGFLGAIGGSGATEALRLLEDGRGEEILIHALKNDTDETVREVAIRSLVMIEESKKTGKAIPSLIDVLKNDKNPNVRAETAFFMAFIKWDRRVIDALIQALNDEELVPLPGYDVAPVKFSVAMALAKIGDKRSIEAIVPYALGESIWTVNATAEAFKRIEPSAVKYIVQGLKMQSWESRERAAASLGEIGDARAVKPLIDALKDGHWKVRKTTAEALGKIKDVGAVKPLTQALNDDKRDVRNAAKDALRKIQKE